MAAGAVVVGRRGAAGPDVVAVLDELQHVLHALHGSLGEADHLHLLLAVLQDTEFGLVVQ